MGLVKESVCKLCRREKQKLFLKGQRCFTDKCAMERKPYIPGQRAKRRLIETEFYTQLREKQKAKRYYGVWERQFRNYYQKAVRKKGITGEILLQLLETRLDNAIYLLGFAASRAQARQLISHGHVAVDGKKVNISSYQLKEGQGVSIMSSSKEITPIVEAKETGSSLTTPEWLEVDLDNLKGKVLRMPEREDIKAPINERMIIELYSK
ncbi:MAG: 30S ribosomal protein S4 [Actinobacteria bacterium]|nr:30S ribosomal protein S4 [Actinomycetota bacterium]